MTSRKTTALELASWVGGETLAVLSAGTGWPAHFRARSTSGWMKVAAYVGPIGGSQRGRDDVERRFQNPGKDRPIVDVPGELPLLLGLYDSDGTRVVVGMEVTKRLGKSTRQSLFMPLHLLRSADTWGWAEHFSDAGERLIAFTPRLLRIYLELTKTGLSIPAHQIESVLVASGATDVEAPDENVERAIVTVDRLLRAAKFSKNVRRAYDGRCAMCGLDFILVEGAHIYPVAAIGSQDDIQNGVALCRNHHAAFDAFLVHVHPASGAVTLHPDLVAQGQRDAACKTFVQSTFSEIKRPSLAKHTPSSEMFEKRYEFFKAKYDWARSSPRTRR